MGESVVISLQSWLLVNNKDSFSLALESILSRPLSLPWVQFLKFLDLCLCTLWMWLSKDSHLAFYWFTITTWRWSNTPIHVVDDTPLPVSNEITVLHLCTSFKLFTQTCYNMDNIVLLIVGIHVLHTFCYMPDIIVVDNTRIILPQPFVNLLVSVSNKNLNR